MILGDRILVLGCPGSGISELSNRLKDILGLPLIQLDLEYYGRNWKLIDEKSWENQILKYCQSKNWIMEGNYLETLDLRINYADSILYLDYDKSFCMERALRNIVKKVESLNLPKNYKDELSRNLLLNAWNFREKTRPKIKEILDKRSDKKILIFNNIEEVKIFIESLDK